MDCFDFVRLIAEIELFQNRFAESWTSLFVAKANALFNKTPPRDPMPAVIISYPNPFFNSLKPLGFKDLLNLKNP